MQRFYLSTAPVSPVPRLFFLKTIVFDAKGIGKVFLPPGYGLTIRIFIYFYFSVTLRHASSGCISDTLGIHVLEDNKIC